MLNLVIPVISLLSSLLVVVITSASNIWSKKIDIDQKQEDRDQELRKLYLTRKLEAGEKVIARRVKLLTNVEYNIQHYKMFIGDSGYFNRNFKDVLEETRALSKADRGESSAYLLYFDMDQSDEAQVLANKLNEVKNKLLICLQERSRLLTLDAEKQESNGFDVEAAYYKKQDEIDLLAPTFFSISQDFKTLLIKSCDEIRNSLKKYELH